MLAARCVTISSAMANGGWMERDVPTLTSQDIIDIFGGGAPRPAEDATDEFDEQSAPCGGGCGPEGCWSDHCPVGQPSDGDR